MADPTTFDQLRQKLFVRWSNRPRAGAFLSTFSALKDDANARTKQAAMVVFPARTDDSALDAAGSNRYLERVPGESHKSFRTYLERVWDIWTTAGTRARLIDEMTRLGFTAQHWSYWQLVEAAGAPKTSFGKFSSFFFMIISGSALNAAKEWADGQDWKETPADLWGLQGFTIQQLEAIKAQIQKWKDAGNSCRFIVLQMDPSQPVIFEAKWRKESSPTAQPLAGLHIDGRGDVWAPSTVGVIWKWNGAFSGVRVDQAGTAAINDMTSWSISANGSTAIRLAVGAGGRIFSGGVVFGQETQWGEVLPSPTVQDLFSVWGPAYDDVWAVGAAGKAVHFDGFAWTTTTTGTMETLREVWGGVPGWPQYVFTCGTQGEVLWWDGTAWTSIALPTTVTMHGIWGDTNGRVWFVGANGHTWHIEVNLVTGALSAPTQEATGTTEALRSIWGSAPDKVWAVGTNGVIFFWDGATWASVTSPTTQALYRVRGTAENDIWAVGAGGAVIRYAKDLGGGPFIVIPMHESWERESNGAYRDFYNYSYLRR